MAPAFPHQLPAIPGDESFQPENDAIPDEVLKQMEAAYGAEENDDSCWYCVLK